MRLTYILKFLFAFGLAYLSLALFAQTNIKYGPDYVVFEAEDTSSPLDKWKLRTPTDPLYHLGPEMEAINQTYIDFRGAWASKESPLSYTFTCPKTGNYRLVMRMLQPLQEGEKGDQRNDVFIKMDGNFSSQTNTSKTELENWHKFWGRGVRTWGSCHKLEIGGSHMNAVYGFIEGEQYTLTMSGRSPWTSIDYILLFDVALNLQIVNHTDIAEELPQQYQPNISTAIVEEVKRPNVKIFPNPVSNNMSLAIQNEFSTASVSIFKLNGQKVYQSVLNFHLNEIDMTKFEAGMYLVKIQQDKEIFTQKIIVKK